MIVFFDFNFFSNRYVAIFPGKLIRGENLMVTEIIKYVFLYIIFRFSIGYNLRLFIAGISTVCCAVISQKQPALFRLTRQHIELGWEWSGNGQIKEKGKIGDGQTVNFLSWHVISSFAIPLKLKYLLQETIQSDPCPLVDSCSLCGHRSFSL